MVTKQVLSCVWGVVAIAVVVLSLRGGIAYGDLYGHWPLNDGTGEVADNRVVGGVDGSIFDWDAESSLGGTPDAPSVWVKDSTRGTVLGLNGNTQWVDAGTIPVMTLQNDFSWAFWARVPSTQASPNNDIVLGNRWGVNGSDTAPREFIKFTTNRFEYHMNGGFGDDLAYADSNLPLGEWVFNSIVKKGSSLSVYRNGEFRNSTKITGGQSSQEPLPFGFGGDIGSNGGEAWRGSISDVQLYTSALTADQIATAMKGTTVANASLYAHYPLKDGGDSDVVMGTGPGAVPGGGQIGNVNAGLGPGGSVWLDDPERGTVLSVAGTFVDAGQLPIMDLSNDFTWNFWSKSDPGQAQTDASIIMGNRNDANGTDAGEFIKFTNDRIEFHVDGTGASDLQWGDAGPNDIRMPNDNVWYHHVVVKDGAAMKYYRNGELRNEVSLGLGQQTKEELPFAMGGQAAPDQPGGETSIVYLSDVRLYTNALTPNEVAALAGVQICNSNTRGDIDGNGKVEFADFLILSSNFGKAATSHTVGDLDCSGDVAFNDFLVLSANFGTSVAGPPEVVPEPSTIGLLSIASLLLGTLRRRRN